MTQLQTNTQTLTVCPRTLQTIQFTVGGHGFHLPDANIYRINFHKAKRGTGVMKITSLTLQYIITLMGKCNRAGQRLFSTALHWGKKGLNFKA